MSFTALEVVLALALIVSLSLHCLAWSWFRAACKRGSDTFQEISDSIESMQRRLDESRKKRESSQ